MIVKRIFNILLYVFVMIVPILSSKVKLGKIPLSSDFLIGGLLILAGCVIVVIDFKSTVKKFKKLLNNRIFAVFTAVVCIFILICTISVLYARDKSAAVAELARFMEYVLIFYFIMLYCTKREIQNSLVLFLASMLVAAAYGMLQFALDFSAFKNITVLDRGRVFATFVNPNYWGAAVNLVIFLPLCLIAERKKYSKNLFVINIVYLVFMAANLILCMTKGSWLGFAAGIIVISVTRYRRGLLYLAGGGFLAMLSPKVRNYMVSAFTLQSYTSFERIRLWKTGLYMFKDHIFTGVGNGNYNAYYYEYVQKHMQELDLGKKLFSVHNSYIKMLAELGIFGFAAFVGVYFILAGFAVKVYKNSEGLLKICALALMGFWASYLFQNFFNNLIFIPQLNVFAWIFTGMLYKYYLLEKGEKLNEDKQ